MLSIFDQSAGSDEAPYTCEECGDGVSCDEAKACSPGRDIGDWDGLCEDCQRNQAPAEDTEIMSAAMAADMYWDSLREHVAEAEKRVPF